MKIISHRGNLDGPNILENHPLQIIKAIDFGFDVEVDIWGCEEKFWSGHDKPTHTLSTDFIISIMPNTWFHCKNLEAIYMCKNFIYDLNFFWHESDQYTITSKGYIWTYPGMQLNKFSINVLPEQSKIYDNNCFAICTDYPLKYKEKLDILH